MGYPLESRRRWLAGLLLGLGSLASCDLDYIPNAGDFIPDSELEVLDATGTLWTPGERHLLSELDGKPIVLDFWASWCDPCRQQHVHVLELKRRFGDRIHVIGVLYKDSPANAREWLRENNASYPTVMEVDGTLADALWLRGLPQLALLTPDRRLSWGLLSLPWGQEGVEARIEALLGLAPSSPFARRD